MTPFFMAWGMFCAIPCPVKKWDQDKYPGMLLSMPFIGLMIGALWMLAARGFTLWGQAKFFAAALLAVLPSLLSGFIHLDGYMDCSDAVLSRRDLETRQKILKDSHVGSFAVISFSLWLLFSFSLFAGMDWAGKELCLLCIPAVTRSVSATAVLSFTPMSTSGYAKMPESVRPFHKWMAVGEMLAFAAAGVLLCGVSGWCVSVAAVGSWATILFLRHDLQGMSGDISGSAITVGELCGVLAMAVL